MTKDTRIFKASEIEHGRAGWIADMSPPNIVSPDHYWRFRTRAEATAFVALVDIGMTMRDAERIVLSASDPRQSAAAMLGSARSERKTAANRAKANLPPKPGKRPRGRPRKTE